MQGASTSAESGFLPEQIASQDSATLGRLQKELQEWEAAYSSAPSASGSAKWRLHADFMQNTWASIMAGVAQRQEQAAKAERLAAADKARDFDRRLTEVRSVIPAKYVMNGAAAPEAGLLLIHCRQQSARFCIPHSTHQSSPVQEASKATELERRLAAKQADTVEVQRRLQQAEARVADLQQQLQAATQSQVSGCARYGSRRLVISMPCPSKCFLQQPWLDPVQCTDHTKLYAMQAANQGRAAKEAQAQISRIKAEHAKQVAELTRQLEQANTHSSGVESAASQRVRDLEAYVFPAAVVQVKINVAQLLRSTRFVQSLLTSCRQLARVQSDEQRLRQQAEAAGAQTAAARSENQQQAHQLEHSRSEIASIQVSLRVVSPSNAGFLKSECHIKVRSCARGDWMQPSPSWQTQTGHVRTLLLSLLSCRPSWHQHLQELVGLCS